MSVSILCGDCIDIVPTLGVFDFIFADPPFNTNQNYQGYDDNRTDYQIFMENWIKVCWDACNDIMALHGNDQLAEIYLEEAKKLKMKRVAWINWHYRFGQYKKTTWIDARCHCLIYSKHDQWTWNPDDVLVESDRVKYKDKRTNMSKDKGKRVPGTVWGIPSDGKFWGKIQGNNEERRKNHPNQLPEVYLERLILAYSNEGNRVLDPFGGSGTTTVVGHALNRKCVTVDISASNCESIERRVKDGAKRTKSKINP